jgi:hypothetical protein
LKGGSDGFVIAARPLPGDPARRQGRRPRGQPGRAAGVGMKPGVGNICGDDVGACFFRYSSRKAMDKRDLASLPSPLLS